MTASPHHPTTLIVGAGPTGLTLAIELARRGVPIRIIDRGAERTRTSRAIGTQARTVEGFRLLGIPESELETRFLVGADGAHSVVRHEAGIGFAGAAYPERFLLADLDLEWDLPHDEGHIWIGDDGLVAAIPLPAARRYRVIVPLPPAYATKEYKSEAEIAAEAETLLGQRTGVTLRRIGDPVWASAFRIQRRQADRYRQGPIFLAGDAAHIHSPVGGQGMNTGIQDAFNLGWKLALAARGQAAPGLLDSYQAERHPIARGVLRGTHLGTRLILAQNPVMRAVREQAVPLFVNIPAVRRCILTTVSQLSIGYRASPLSVDADDQEARGLLGGRGARGLQAGDRV